MPAMMPHVAVEHVLVVVVADLHDAVAGAEGPAACLPLDHPALAGFSDLLQALVERGHAYLAAMHRAEHLDFVRPQAELARDALGHQLDHQVGGFGRVLLLEEKKSVGAAIVQHRHLAAVDPVRVGDDVAAFRLAEDGVETDDGAG